MVKEGDVKMKRKGTKDVKSVRLRLEEVVAIAKTLDTLLELELEIGVAYKIARLTKIFRDELVAFDDARLRLIGRYAEKDENGVPVIDFEKGQYLISKKNEKLFQSEFRKLLDMEIGLEIPKLSVRELPKDGKIKSGLMLNLLKVIESGEE